MNNLVRIGYRNDRYIVTIVTDWDYAEDQVLAGVLRSFESIDPAIEYACGVNDGVKSYLQEGAFVPTPPADIPLTKEAVEALLGDV